MPAHRRGMIALPGGVSVASADDGPTQPFCPLCTPLDAENGNTPDAPVNCAICYLKVGLDVPPVVILAPAFVDQLDYLIGRFDRAESPLLTPQIMLHGRAPPATA